MTLVTVRLFGDLGFDRDHQNVCDFDVAGSSTSPTDAREAWLSTKSSETYEANYDKVRNALKLEMDWEDARTKSYAVITFPATDNAAAWDWFGFVDSVALVNDRTVEFVLSEDVYQTYLGKHSLGYCYVERAHVNRWGSGSTPELQIYPHEAISGFNRLGLAEVLDYPASLTISNIDVMFVCVAWTSGTDTAKRVRYGMFPVSAEESTVCFGDYDQKKPFPSLNMVMNGYLPVAMNIDPSAIQSVVIVPFADVMLSFSAGYFAEGISQYAQLLESQRYTWLEGTTVSDSGSTLNFGIWERNLSIVSGSPQIPSVAVTLSTPTKPTDGAAENMDFEPAMFMSPCRSVSVFDGSGGVLWTAPDDALLAGNIDLRPGIEYSASGANNTMYIGDSKLTQEDVAEADALNRAFKIPGRMFDLATNEWLSYVQTQRNTDREILASNQVRSLISAGTSIGASLATGNPIGAVTAGISAATDYYYQGKDQEFKEQGIKNQTAGLLQGGEGPGAIGMHAVHPVAIETEADDTTRRIFFDKVRRYGYMIDRFMEYDTASRKIFNYVRTSRAQVRGSFPEDVRAQLARIYDGGVTIWHDPAKMFDETEVNIERTLIRWRERHTASTTHGAPR